NLGGIANITLRGATGLSAFDIGPCNQVLNRLAAREGLLYDDAGQLAATGALDITLLQSLNAAAYFTAPAPKSLSNEAALALGEPALQHAGKTADLLHTYCAHIAAQVAAAISADATGGQMLATGGGALNTFLLEQIRQALGPRGIEVV